MTAGPESPSAAPVTAIPRAYNFADDLFRRWREAGWLEMAAYIDPRGTWTYRQLAWRAEQFSLVLENMGIQPGERVLMSLTDTIDWPTVFLGTLYAGRVAVPVNRLSREAYSSFMLGDS